MADAKAARWVSVQEAETVAVVETQDAKAIRFLAEAIPYALAQVILSAAVDRV
jgi:hypothetical protein